MELKEIEDIIFGQGRSTVNGRLEYATKLDRLWATVSAGKVSGMERYCEQVRKIKAKGLKVYRDSAGRHIVK